MPNKCSHYYYYYYYCLKKRIVPFILINTTHSNQFLKLGSPTVSYPWMALGGPLLVSCFTHEFILVHAVYTSVLISYF